MWAVYASLLNVGPMVIAPPISGFVITHYGYYANFLVFALLAFPALAVLPFVKPYVKSSKE